MLATLDEKFHAAAEADHPHTAPIDYATRDLTRSDIARMLATLDDDPE